MTTPELTDLLRRGADVLDPAAADRILAGAVRAGDRRRRRRHVAVLGTAAAVTAGVAAAALVAGPAPTEPSDPGVATTGTDPASATPVLPSSPPTSYAPGTETQVPEGPVVPTDRRLATDAELAATLTRLAAAYGDVAGVGVEPRMTRTVGHTADRTLDGRAVTFALDGAGASVELQRWDGYAAVGAELPADWAGGPLEEADLVQTVDDTAEEACTRYFECRRAPEGWYWVDRPSQGAAVSDSYQELLVTLFTDDGWVVQVDAYNTPAEKNGPPVSERPVLDVAESVALATSPEWFRPTPR